MDNKTLTLLSRSPIAKKLVAEEESANVAERKRLAAEIVKIKADLAKVLPPLRIAHDEAHAEVVKAQAGYEAALAKRQDAYNVLANASAVADAAIARLEATLRDSADSEQIDKLVAELEVEHSALRFRGNVAEMTDAGFDFEANKRRIKIVTDAPAIDRRIRAVADAIRVARYALPLEPLSGKELRERCRSIVASLPAIVNTEAMA